MEAPKDLGKLGSYAKSGEPLIWHVHIWISFNYNDYAIWRVVFSHQLMTNYRWSVKSMGFIVTPIYNSCG